MIGGVLGFIVGFIFGVLRAPMEPWIPGILGGLGGLVWLVVVVRMAVRKQYRDFRIALVPRGSGVGEVFR